MRIGLGPANSLDQRGPLPLGRFQVQEDSIERIEIDPVAQQNAGSLEDAIQIELAYLLLQRAEQVGVFFHNQNSRLQFSLPVYRS